MLQTSQQPLQCFQADDYRLKLISLDQAKSRETHVPTRGSWLNSSSSVVVSRIINRPLKACRSNTSQRLHYVDSAPYDTFNRGVGHQDVLTERHRVSTIQTPPSPTESL